MNQHFKWFNLCYLMDFVSLFLIDINKNTNRQTVYIYFYPRPADIYVTLSVGPSLPPSKEIQIQNSQLWSLIESWGYHENISPMTRTKMMWRSRTTRMTMRRSRNLTRRRTMTSTKLSNLFGIRSSNRIE